MSYMTIASDRLEHDGNHLLHQFDYSDLYESLNWSLPRGAGGEGKESGTFRGGETIDFELTIRLQQTFIHLGERLGNFCRVIKTEFATPISLILATWATASQRWPEMVKKGSHFRFLQIFSQFHV